MSTLSGALSIYSSYLTGKKSKSLLKWRIWPHQSISHIHIGVTTSAEAEGFAKCNLRVPHAGYVLLACAARQLQPVLLKGLWNDHKTIKKIVTSCYPRHICKYFLYLSLVKFPLHNASMALLCPIQFVCTLLAISGSGQPQRGQPRATNHNP